MYWNYRVIFEDDLYTIRTVFYDEADQILACSEEAIDLTGESCQELQSQAELILKALQLPVLSVADLPPIESRPVFRRGISLAAARDRLAKMPEVIATADANEIAV